MRRVGILGVSLLFSSSLALGQLVISSAPISSGCGFTIPGQVCTTVNSTHSNQTGPRTICYACATNGPIIWSFPATGGRGPRCETLSWQGTGWWGTSGSPPVIVTERCAECHTQNPDGTINLLSSSAFSAFNFCCGKICTGGKITSFSTTLEASDPIDLED